MLLPGKLSITDYCQIAKLIIDFGTDNVFAITGTNGAGKSNALNALRFALSGLSSPGADKLSDDVRDEAEKAIVELDFTIDDTGTGHIKREIFKSGGANCTLTINMEGHPKEVITKSKRAEARFLELLGVSPKHISEIVIADQHSIEALLFWPAAERGPKFQRFLHGQMFQDAEKIIQKERKLVLLDPRAQERKESLQKSLVDPEQDKRAAEKEITRIEKFLAKEEVRKVLEKAKKVEEFTVLKAELNTLEVAKQEQEVLGAAHNKALQEFPESLEKDTEQLKKQIQHLEQQWNEYRPYAAAQAQLEGITHRKEKLESRLVELKGHIDGEGNIKVELENLKQSKNHWELSNQLSNLEQQALATKEFEEAAKAKVKLHAEKILIYDGDLKDEPTYHLLDEVIKHLDTHDKNDCVVCGGELTATKIKDLKTKHKQLGDKISKVRQAIANETQAKIDIEKEIHSANKDLEEIKQNIVKVEKAITEAPKPKIVWAEELLEKINITEIELSLLPSRIEEAKDLTEEKTNIDTSIFELNKVKKVATPKETEQVLAGQKKVLEELEANLNKLIEIRRESDKNSGQILQLTSQITCKKKEFSDKGYPDCSKEWQLSTNEQQLISDISNEKDKLTIEREALAGATGSIKSISEQVRKAELEVVGFEQTKLYSGDLEQLEGWFRYNGIPSQILRQQLNSLCIKMEAIIKRFQLKQAFKLSVDESLEVHMVYPSGATRPITKASGGERIILGIAFRLATHSCLSPELPLLALDEPSNHLFEANQTILQELIRSLKTNLHDYGLRKFIYCTHSKALANEAEKIIDLS